MMKIVKIHIILALKNNNNWQIIICDCKIKPEKIKSYEFNCVFNLQKTIL